MHRLLRSARSLFLLPLVGVFALGACAETDDSTVQVVVIGQPSSPFAGGVRLSPAAQLVRSSTFEGLVGFDEQGRVIPALADRWIVTDDGQSYIFRLREGAWPDGTPLTGDSVRIALRRAIAELRGTPLALDLAAIEDIRAMAGRVVEIRLERPVPDMLQLLAQPELGLARKGRGTGPMVLRREGDVAILKAIPPEKRGLPAVSDWSERTRTIQLVAVPAASAIDRFDKGEADLVLGGTIDDFPRLASRGLARGTIRMDAVTGLFGLSVMSSEGFLANPAHREAISMAIDREALIAGFGISGWIPTTRIVSPGIDTGNVVVEERWTTMTLAERQAEAGRRVREWADKVTLRIALPEGPGSDLLFASISRDLGTAGISAIRVAQDASAELRLVDTVARYPRAGWFLNQFSCRAGRVPCSAAADSWQAQANAADESAPRDRLVAEAEAALAATNIFIPFGTPVRWSLARGNLTGFSINRWGYHPLMPLAMRPR